MVARGTYDFDVEDVEYLRHGERSLLTRLYKPRGEGPFPAMLELHGGSWCMFERTRGVAIHRALARSGVFVSAPDWRQGTEVAYPEGVADINYAIRWLKAHAEQFNIRSDRVGLSGTSSGGHLAALLAMRPSDPRYNSIPLPAGLPSVNARLHCVVLVAPVINPLGRYRYAKRLKATASPCPDWVDLVLPYHDAFWRNEETMAEGNPMLMLERGEEVERPPMLYIVGHHDDVHDYHDPESDVPGTETDRFVLKYRKAGGSVQLERFDAGVMFITMTPELPEAVRAVDTLVDFVWRQNEEPRSTSASA